MSRGLGFTVPQFEDISEEEATSLLDTGIELMGMIRDGDSESDDYRARELYRRLITPNQT